MQNEKTPYELGLTGEPLPEGSGWWKKLRHGRGIKKMAEYASVDAEFHASYKQRFEHVAQHAEGHNSEVFAILRSAAEIPESNRLPLKGYSQIEQDGQNSHQWVRLFSFGENPNDPSGTFHTPLARPMGSVHLDSLEWSHNGFTTPVRTLEVFASATADSEGALGDAQSTLVINRLKYDPDTLELDYDDTFTGAITVQIDPSGEVSSVERSSSSTTGKTSKADFYSATASERDQQELSISVDSLLKNLHASVTDTVLTYRSMHDELNETRSGL